ncbi:tetratricopeptide repeat protein [Streptomyces avermitilis]|uniref:tetratricopeptide repeat protein n=1 Tax=Streptomyces avermitilis TaxID=33903 RepID=UPI0033CFBA81
MSPRTNDSAPESDGGEQPPAGPEAGTAKAGTPASAIGTAEAMPEKPSAGTTPEKPSAGPTAEEPAAGATTEESSAGATAEEPAADATAEEPAADITPEGPSAGTTAEKPSAGATTEESLADATAEEPAADATDQEPAADATDQEPAADITPEEPSAGATTEEPQVGTTAQELPAGAPAQEDVAQEAPAQEDVAQEAPAQEDVAQEAPAQEDVAQVPGSGADGVLDERVVAVRRLSVSGRRRRAAQLGFCAAALAVALTAGAVVLGAVRDGGTANVAAAPVAVSPQLLASGDLDASITSLQAHLRAQPKDFGGWATLGLAYIEQARTKGDPSRYPQAQRALDRSLRLRPDNDPALAGRAALAAARHDFHGALTYADRALKQNPYSERALSSRIDALVELGRYDDASKAADVADRRRPGVPVFTRYAYVRELRGDVKTARRVLEQALSSATSRGDISYVASALGQLSWNQGEYKTALTYYARALAADDSYLPALEGRARAQAAQGDSAAAIRGMEQVVERFPLPQPLVELGELYEARGKEGDPQKARDQYALVDAWVALARANGVNADLDTALAAADHGDRKAALKAARAEWARRHTVHTADALAWALHVNGRDKEALPYARRATATGYHNASFLYHRGMIERAAGDAKEARASLKSALDLNPGFSSLGARKARTALGAAK